MSRSEPPASPARAPSILGAPARAPRILGLGVRAPGPMLACAVLVFVVLLATMPHAIGLFDEGELAVAAYELGLGHPFGQPLHVLLGFVFAHLPGVQPTTGLVTLSALFSALATIPAIVLAERAMPTPGPTFLPAATVAAVALHGASWEASTRIEVYPIAAFFALYALARLARSPDAPASGHHGEDTRGARVIFGAGLALGLSASANPLVATAGLVAALPLLPAWLAGAPKARLLAGGVLGGMVGLAPYLYLFVAAHRTDALVWGGLSSWSEVAHYVSGRDYGGNLSASLETRLDHTIAMLGYLGSGRAFTPALIVGALGIGTVAFARERRSIAAAMAAAVVLPLAIVASNAVFRVDVPDYLGYLAVPMLVLGASAAPAIAAALGRTPFAWLFLAAMAFGTVVGTPVAWERSRSADDVTARLASAVLDEAPRNAILVLESDHLVAPLLYVQRVEHRRRDVVVVIRGLMSSGWYVRFLARAHPSLHGYALRGEGGRDGRIARLLAANPTRAVRVEHLDLAVALRRRACPGGLTLPTETACRGASPSLGTFVRLANGAYRLPDGALDGRSVVPAVSFRIALDLFRFGRSRDAYVVLVAGLPPEYRQGLPTPEHVRADDRLEGALPVFQRARALGDPAKNAFVAANLLSHSGQVDAAILLTRRAAEDGLPEAIELLRRASR